MTINYSLRLWSSINVSLIAHIGWALFSFQAFRRQYPWWWRGRLGCMTSDSQLCFGGRLGNAAHISSYFRRLPVALPWRWFAADSWGRHEDAHMTGIKIPQPRHGNVWQSIMGINATANTRRECLEAQSISPVIATAWYSVMRAWFCCLPPRRHCVIAFQACFGRGNARR